MTFGPYAFAAAPRSAPVNPGRDIPLGRGYRYGDLHDADRLRDLDADFRRALATAAPALSERFEAYRAGAELPPPADGDLLIAVARHLSQFVSELFGLVPQLTALRETASGDQPIFRLREFIARRAIKKYGPGSLTTEDAATLDAALEPAIAALGRSPSIGNGRSGLDRELEVGRTVSALLDLESGLSGDGAAPESLRRLHTLAAWQGDPASDLALVRNLLDRFERWAARAPTRSGGAAPGSTGGCRFTCRTRSTTTELVPLRRPGPGLPNVTEVAARASAAARRFHADRRAHVGARGADRGRLLPLLPRAREGLLLARDARQAGRA